jgi:hypothetical protein
MGIWRFSMAALIVFAALLDIVWWVPAHQPSDRSASPQVQPELPQCRKARLQAEIDRLQAELDAIP